MLSHSDVVKSYPMDILSKFEAVVSTRDCSLDVAEDSVYPVEAAKVGAFLVGTNHHRLMLAS